MNLRHPATIATIPAPGLPAVGWESRMTMTGARGYSAHGPNWKSAEGLIPDAPVFAPDIKGSPTIR